MVPGPGYCDWGHNNVCLQVSLLYGYGSLFSYLKTTPMLFATVAILIYLSMNSFNLTFFFGEMKTNFCSYRYSVNNSPK